MPLVVSIDFETWCTVDIRAGISNYARELKVLMMAWHIVGDPAPTELWRPGMRFPDKMYAALNAGAFLSGWNSMNFERIVWRERCIPDHGFPEVPDNVWIDSMYLAAAANLPRSLDGCARAVGAEAQKDADGHKLMLRVTNGNRTPWPPEEADILRLGVYCIQDVDTEEATALRLPPWPDMEPWVAMPAVDRRINDRGVRIDVPLVAGMARAAAMETRRLDAEMARLTNEAVERTSTVEQLKRWLVDRGVDVPRKDGKRNVREEDALVEGAEDEQLEGVEDDAAESEAEKGSPWRLRKNDIANLLATDIPEDCRAALFMRIEAAKASARKLNKMLSVADAYGVVSGFLTLMGAQATGRFASGGPQWHNMVRDAFAKDYETIAAKNGLDAKKDKPAVRALAARMLATAIEAGRTGDPDLLRAMYEAPRTDLQGRIRVEGVLPWVSRMSRRVVAAGEGKLLLNGDFANIQARIPVWLAGQEETVQAFARGEDLYRQQASPVYGLPPETLSAEQRQIGKVMRLFLGFGAGVNAFIPACMIYGIVIPRDMGSHFVKLFRETNKPLVDFWDANLQAAVWAVQNPGMQFFVPPKGLVSWFTYGDCLCCMLPSGRLLRYWEPRLSQGYWADGTPKRTLDLTALFVKGRARFRRTLWRGLAMQNITCAIEADLLCTALRNMDRADLPVRLHVHDNAAVEVDEDKAESLLPRFKACMLDQPAWTAGLPIAVDVDVSARFG